MQLSVVIPAYEHIAEVLTCLNSLRALRVTNAVTFHVQDDCSPTVDFRGVIPPEVATVARNERNLGFAGNCNAGAQWVIARQQQPGVVLFCNQDVFGAPEWSNGWDAALLEAFDDLTVGAVGARLLFPNGAVQNAGGTFDQLAQPMHRCLGWADAHNAEVETAREVEWTTGAALAVRSDVLARLEGFDEHYARGYFEDVDLCLRVRALGLKVWYEPGCTFIHHTGTSGGSTSFSQNARRFKAQWVDSGKVRPGQLLPTVRYW